MPELIKKTIFLSHITEEKELTSIFQQLIEDSFFGQVHVFTSSFSIKPGQRWFDEIEENLKNSAIMIVFCSPKSIQRPWISFECGAGWQKNINVIPLCHSGLTVDTLPSPLNLLEGGNISDKNKITDIFEIIKNEIGFNRLPIIDFDSLFKKINEFENKYLSANNKNTIDLPQRSPLSSIISKILLEIKKINPGFFERLKTMYKDPKMGLTLPPVPLIYYSYKSLKCHLYELRKHDNNFHFNYNVPSHSSAFNPYGNLVLTVSPEVKQLIVEL